MPGCACAGRGRRRTWVRVPAVPAWCGCRYGAPQPGDGGGAGGGRLPRGSGGRAVLGATRTPSERGGARPRAGLPQRAGASRTSARARPRPWGAAPCPPPQRSLPPSEAAQRQRGGTRPGRGAPRCLGRPPPGRAAPLSAVGRRRGRWPPRAPSGSCEGGSVERAVRAEGGGTPPLSPHFGQWRLSRQCAAVR